MKDQEGHASSNNNINNHAKQVESVDDENVGDIGRSNSHSTTAAVRSTSTDSMSKLVESNNNNNNNANPETEVPRAEEKTSPGSAARGKLNNTNSSNNVTSNNNFSSPTSRVPSGGDKVGSEGSGDAVDFTSPTGGVGKGLGALKPLNGMSGGGGGGGGRINALPHHIPKMDNLSSKMEDIRKNMGDEVSLILLVKYCLFICWLGLFDLRSQ